MGMFDYVKCERPLPDGWDLTNDAVGLQTKDFDCEMTTLRITAEGRLVVERFETEVVPKEERPYPDGDGLFGLMGSLRRVNQREVDLNYHGTFSFGGLEDLKDDEWVVHGLHPGGGFWRKRYRDHGYLAKFTDGQLVALEVDPD